RLLEGIPCTALEPDVTHERLRSSLGRWRAVHGQWAKAAANFAVLMHLHQLHEEDAYSTDDLTVGSSLDYLYLGPSLVERSDLGSYETLRRSTVARLALTPNCIIAERVCKGSLLLAADNQLTAALAPLYDLAAKAQERSELSNDMKAWACISLALVDYRRGDYARSVEWSQRCLASASKKAECAAAAQVLLAMGCE